MKDTVEIHSKLLRHLITDLYVGKGVRWWEGDELWQGRVLEVRADFRLQVLCDCRLVESVVKFVEFDKVLERSSY